jgi:hypothetical protein
VLTRLAVFEGLPLPLMLLLQGLAFRFVLALHLFRPAGGRRTFGPMTFFLAGLLGSLLLLELGAFRGVASFQLTRSGRGQAGRSPSDPGVEDTDLTIPLAGQTHGGRTIDVPHAEVRHPAVRERLDIPVGERTVYDPAVDTLEPDDRPGLAQEDHVAGG